MLPQSGSRQARRLVQQKRIPIQTIVLRTLYVSGVIGTALIAPNAVKLFKDIGGKENRKRLYYRIGQARRRLEHKGLIRVHKGGAVLTEQGRKMVGKIIVTRYEIKEPIFWDGKWRVVIFDVREKRRKVRNVLRVLLGNAGFKRLQDSVWIFPYPCDEFVELVRAQLRSGVGEMLFFTTEAFAGDTHLRHEFGLQ